MQYFLAALGAFVALILFRFLLVYFSKEQQLTSKKSQAILAKFEQETKQLCRLFFETASKTGMPRGLNWKECQQDFSTTRYAYDSNSHEILAMVEATISFTAIKGGMMEEAEAVSNLRAGTAIYVYRAQGWTTSGRAIFNLDPAETLQHFGNKYQEIRLET